MVYTCDKGYCVGADGGLSDSNGLLVSQNDVEQTFNALTGQSPYAYEDEVRQGFLTLETGIRAGLAGSALLAGGNMRTYKTVSGINFRIPREAKGVITSYSIHYTKLYDLCTTETTLDLFMYEAVKDAVSPIIHTFIATSPIHMEYKLKMKPEDVLNQAIEMVKYAKSLCPEVEFS